MSAVFIVIIGLFVGSLSCTIRCGGNWTDANTKCGQCCTDDANCTNIPTDNGCYDNLDITPCGPSTTTIGNLIGDYRIATISGCGTGKFISLTFDDGPSEPNNATLTIINTLNARGIAATFYVSPAANGADQWGLDQRCALIQQLTDAGNEIQSHSWSHPDFAVEQLTEQQIKTELDTTSDFIINCGGQKPTIFRPPYGSLNKQQAEYIVKDLRYIISLWNLDSNDWRTPNNLNGISSNINNLMSLYANDSINILMHDHSVYNISDGIIDLFINNEYQFITQSECFRRCDTIDVDGVCNDIHGQDLNIINDWRSTDLTPSPTKIIFQCDECSNEYSNDGIKKIKKIKIIFWFPEWINYDLTNIECWLYIIFKKWFIINKFIEFQVCDINIYVHGGIQTNLNDNKCLLSVPCLYNTQINNSTSNVSMIIITDNDNKNNIIINDLSLDEMQNEFKTQFNNDFSSIKMDVNVSILIEDEIGGKTYNFVTVIIVSIVLIVFIILIIGVIILLCIKYKINRKQIQTNGNINVNTEQEFEYDANHYHAFVDQL